MTRYVCAKSASTLERGPWGTAVGWAVWVQHRVTIIKHGVQRPGEGCAVCSVGLLCTFPSLLQGHHLHFPSIGVTSWTPDLTDIYMEAAYTNSGPGACTLSTWPTELVSPGPQCTPFSKPEAFAYLWLNAQHQQLQGRHIYFGSLFQKVQSVIMWPHALSEEHCCSGHMGQRSVVHITAVGVKI